MIEKVECEIFIVIDEAGNYAVGVDEDQAHDLFHENVGGNLRRTAKIIAKMAPAVMPEATVEIPDDAGSTETVEAEAA